MNNTNNNSSNNRVTSNEAPRLVRVVSTDSVATQIDDEFFAPTSNEAQNSDNPLVRVVTLEEENNTLAEENYGQPLYRTYAIQGFHVNLGMSGHNNPFDH